MNAYPRWSNALVVLGLAAMLVGAVGPLEGSRLGGRSRPTSNVEQCCSLLSP